MGKSSPSVPKAPDPTKTADAQTASNEATALYQAQLNNVNQVTPYGSLTYSQTGGQPTYNMDAYNSALAAWNAAPTGSAAGPDNPYEVGSEAYQAFQSQFPDSGQASTSKGAMPQLSDYQTAATGAPQFTSTINLSPAQQALLDSQTANQQQALGLAGTELNQAQSNLSTPYSLSGNGITQIPSQGDITAYQNQITDAINSRLTPQLDHSQDMLNTRLLNQGIAQGSDAWNKAQTLNSQAVNDAQQQSILSGIQAGSTLMNEGLAANQQGVADYNQQYYAPLNAYNSLESGTQVQNPTFAPTGNTQVGGTNVAGITQNAYQSALNSYNQQIASNNSATSGLLGLAGSLGSGFLGSSAGGSWLANLLGGGSNITSTASGLGAVGTGNTLLFS